jgi:excisionase family DNA binding protein
VLRVKQVAERLNLSVSKIYELVESGELPHHRFGGAIRVSEEQIAEYMNRTKRERKSAAPPKGAGPRPRLKHIKL